MSTKTFDQIDGSYLANTLNELIKKDGNLTPASLARKLGIPTNKITRIINGDVTDPKASTLLQIASCFEISIDQLLGLEPIVAKIEEYGDPKPSQLIPIFTVGNTISNEPSGWYRLEGDNVDDNYFAVTVNTDLYEPTFPNGCLIVVNNEITPEDRSFVLVETIHEKPYPSIKKFVMDGNTNYLYPINPKLNVEMYDPKSYNIRGVILEVHQKLK